MANLIKKLFTKEDLTAIAKAIGEAEKSTSGEIRVSIRQKRQRKESKLSMEEMARQEFQALRMTKTKDRTGVLIFLLLEESKFSIFADEGIHTKVGKDTWEKIAGEMSSHFSQKNFRLGIIHGVQAVGAVLAKFFLRKPNDTNELPNNVKIR